MQTHNYSYFFRATTINGNETFYRDSCALGKQTLYMFLLLDFHKLLSNERIPIYIVIR
jgi:hypothetical protein